MANLVSHTKSILACIKDLQIKDQFVVKIIVKLIKFQDFCHGETFFYTTLICLIYHYIAQFSQISN